MKNKFSLPAILLFGILSGQVGINTTEPKTTFDVAASPLSDQKADGVLIPKLSGDDLRAKNNLYEAPQHGALLYITSADSQPAGKTENVTAPGFYFYDSSVQKWVKLSGVNGGNVAGSWFVQNTTNPASVNTDNIYQQGKVAVGFDNTDTVSDKQLEVKGDFKIKGNNSGTYSFLETNGTSFFTGMNANLMYSTNNPVFNQATHASGIVSQPELFLAFKSNPSGVNGSNMVLQDNSFNIGAYNNGIGSNYQISNVSGDANQIVLAYQRNKDGGGIQTVRQIRIHENLGIDFSFFNNQDGVPFSNGGYYFPQNRGNIGQVLTVDAIDSSNTRSLLAWKDAPQLWKIQHTENPAALNTDNIYQQGKVAIGFDKDDAVSNKQLEVKGDFKTQIQTNGMYQGLETNTAIAGIPNRMNMLYSMNHQDLTQANKLSLIGVMDGTALITTSQDNNLTATLSLQNTSTDHSFELGVYKTDFDGSNPTDRYYSSVQGSANGTEMEFTGMNPSVAQPQEISKITLNRKGITLYNYLDDGSTPYSNMTYTFPRGQFMEVGNVMTIKSLNGSEEAQLEFAPLHNLIKGSNGIRQVAGTMQTAEFQLGGHLTIPTTIKTGRNIDDTADDAANTLAITGLTMGTETDKVVVTDTSGVLRTIERNQIIKNIPVYTNDATADSDTNLPSGALYKVTGSRAVYQKP